MDAKSPLPRGSVVGILGGGQLGRMTALAAAPLGFRCHVFCPDPHSPAFHVADRHTCAEYSDLEALETFAEICDVVTFEFENIPYKTLQFLTQKTTLHPSPLLLHNSQNRLREKAFATQCGVLTPNHAPVHNLHDLHLAVNTIGTPGILKTQELGYDGKGQIPISPESDLEAAWESFGENPAIYEEKVDFSHELSVIVARDTAGMMTCFPIAENEHEKGILRRSIAPATLPKQILLQAENQTYHLAESADLVGLLAVEYFLLDDGRLLFNEMAPRPHNSGHWTLDGCHTSQFAQFMRAVTGLPIADVAPHSFVCMVNLLGDEILHRDAMLDHSNVCWHDYGKHHSRPGRKMGHVNFVGVDALDASEKFIAGATQHALATTL